MKDLNCKKIIPIALAGSLIASLGCFGIFRLIGSEVNDEGELIEPFFLIPIGYLFALAFIILLVMLLVMRMKDKK